MSKFFHLNKYSFRLSHVTLVTDVYYNEYIYNEITLENKTEFGFTVQFNHHESNFWTGYKTEAEAVAVRQKLMEALENEPND